MVSEHDEAQSTGNDQRGMGGQPDGMAGEQHDRVGLEREAGVAERRNRVKHSPPHRLRQGDADVDESADQDERSDGLYCKRGYDDETHEAIGMTGRCHLEHLLERMLATEPEPAAEDHRGERRNHHDAEPTELNQPENDRFAAIDIRYNIPLSRAFEGGAYNQTWQFRIVIGKPR